MPKQCWCVDVALRVSWPDSPSSVHWNRKQPRVGRQGRVSLSATSPSAAKCDWLSGRKDSHSFSHTPCIYTRTVTVTLSLATLSSRLWWAAVASCCREKVTVHTVISPSILHTHVYPCGVKRTLVGDAGVASRIGVAAWCKEALLAVDNGSHHRHKEPNGWSCCHESCNQADGEEGPRLRKRKDTNKIIREESHSKQI